MLVVLILIALAIFMNYFLGFKLYKEPKNSEYFHNVKNINTIKMPEIAPDPQYILVVTFLAGIVIGAFIAFANKINASSLYSTTFSIMIGVLYIIEISKRVKLTEDSLVLSKAFFPKKEIPLNEIDGMFIYSPNKRFMNGNALTTKLVITNRKGKTKFTISSLNKKAILNMMKNNFGITDYKMYIANK